MSHPEIPDFGFWELLWYSFLFVLDLGISVFFIEFVGDFLFGGDK